MKTKRTQQPQQPQQPTPPVETKPPEGHHSLGHIDKSGDIVWKPTPNNNLACAGSLVRQVKDVLEDLREVRDLKLYVPSCHTFREWCMREFGERIGGWLEEHL